MRLPISFLVLGILTRSLADTDAPDIRHLKIGEPITLSCEDGTPDPSTIWTVSDSPLIPTETLTILDNGSIYITTATEEHAGTYGCKTSKHGTQKIIHLAYLTFTQEMPTELKVKEFDDLFLECPASGNPQPFTLQWLWNGNPIEASNRRSFSKNSHQVQDGILNIRSIEIGDEGIYTCRLTMAHIQITESTNITVTRILQTIEEMRNDLRNEVRTELGHQLTDLRMEFKADISNLKKMILKVPPGFVEVDGEFFLFVQEEKTWSSARKHCREMGGDLAIPPSDIEALQTLVVDYGGQYDIPWLGGIQEGSSRGYYYLDGTSVPSHLWSPSYPYYDSGCLMMYASRNPPLIDGNCQWNQASICRFG